MDGRTVWAKLPSEWIREGRLKSIRANEVGAGAAALKVYIAMAMNANYAANSQFPAPGLTDISYSELEYVTGLSRSYIKKGIDRLRDLELICRYGDIIPMRYVYDLVGYDSPGVGWAKVPARYLYSPNSGSQSPRLANTSNRGRIAVDSMKVYLTLLAFRSNQANVVLMSYNKIEEYTGIPRRYIRNALDRLVIYSFIHINRQPDTGSGQRSPNEYYLCGDFLGYRSKGLSVVTI